jgi:serine O-acetyltransferase
MLRKNLLLDLSALSGKPATINGIIVRILTDPGFRAVFLYRLAHRLQATNRPIPAAFILRVMRSTTGCNISSKAEIGSGFTIRHTGDIVVGGKTKIGQNCDIRQGVTFGGSIWKSKDGQEQPIVGDDVTVGAGAKIVGPIIIGSRVIVGANAVVVRDVPDDCVVGGVPARVLKQNGRLIPIIMQDSSLGAALRKIERKIHRLDERMDKLEQKA